MRGGIALKSFLIKTKIPLTKQENCFLPDEGDHIFFLFLLFNRNRHTRSERKQQIVRKYRHTIVFLPRFDQCSRLKIAPQFAQNA